MRIRFALAPILVVGILACGGSKSSPTSPGPSPTPIARDVTRTYTVQDTDGRVFGSFSVTHAQGKETLTAAYFQSKGVNVSGIDSNYFAVNADYRGSLFGPQLGSTRVGSLALQYTTDGTSIVTFLKSGIDWAGAFATGGAGVGPGFGNGVPAQTITVRQMLAGESSGSPGNFPIVDGISEPIEQAVGSLQDIVTVGDHQLLQLNFTGKTQTPATLKTGYYPDSYGANGYHGTDFAIVNEYFLRQPRYYSAAYRFMFVELAEVIGGFDDVYGNNSSGTLMNPDDTPSDKGKHLIRAAVLFGLPKQK
ncbi:MAG TPA: hypothetical protein VMU12_00825 [Candidatus Paceibacterota bacterium]|nr:hypothetical protein [Candidatus Paceibacterota bacterium]